MRFFRLTIAFCCLVLVLKAQDKPNGFYELPLDTISQATLRDLSGLLRNTSNLASNATEKLQDAPATMLVITAQEIRERGYIGIEELLSDVTGFDNIIVNGAAYLNSYQRGYRTTFMQRTLIMIDGLVIDNSMWTQGAIFRRQYPIGNVEKVEILYGPASAIYGPNAFLGIINIVTTDGKKVTDTDGNRTTSMIQVGTWNTYVVDFATQGRVGDVSYSIAARLIQSDEEDMSERWGFSSNRLAGNDTIWGPLLKHTSRGKPLGKYLDPTDNYGVEAKLLYKDFILGLVKYTTMESYGTHYPADRVQPNASWNFGGTQIYTYYEKTFQKWHFNSYLGFRTSRDFGQWAEATPDWNAGKERYSYISYTQWNSNSSGWLFRQNFDYQHNKNLTISGGVKYEKRHLTKAYDIPGYWGAYSSIAVNNGLHGFGQGIGHSSDAEYALPPSPLEDMPLNNIAIVRDVGGFVSVIADVKKFRFNMGVRYDENSIYGQVVNPRLCAIFKPNSKSSLKLLFGEAFQEPPGIQLWGGWNGRQANPNLKPERARNLELNFLYGLKNLFQDVSIYHAWYRDVVKEEAENAGNRRIYGFEYRLRYLFENIISPKSKPITGYLFYTFCKTWSSLSYSFEEKKWVEQPNEIGDIAPHKVNFGVNVPMEKLNFNLRANYVSARTLYSRNPLRQRGLLDGYWFASTNLTYHFAPATVGIKVMNLFNNQFFAPGIEQADSGDDFSKRSLGFRSSVIPQPSRSIMLHLTLDL